MILWLGLSALPLTSPSLSWGFVLPLCGICEEADIDRAFSALNSNPRYSSDKLLRAEGPFYTGLGRSPRNMTRMENQGL